MAWGLGCTGRARGSQVRPHPAPKASVLTAFCLRRERRRKAMLSAASSWLISSIFTLYFLICSLMSISTQLQEKGTQLPPAGWPVSGPGVWRGTGWSLGHGGARWRPRAQARPRTQRGLWLPSPVAAYCVTSCGSLHLSEPEALSQQASRFEGGSTSTMGQSKPAPHSPPAGRGNTEV